MPGSGTRFGDLTVLAPGLDPLTGQADNLVPVPLPANLNAVFVSSGLVEMPASRVKTIVVQVTSAITFGAPQTLSVRLYAAMSKYGTLGNTNAATVWGAAGGVSLPTNPFVGGSGAGSTMPTGNVPNTTQYIGPGTAPTLGAAAVSFGPGVFFFTSTFPTTNPIVELANWYPVLGVEFQGSAAVTGGSYNVFFSVAPL